MPEGPKIDEGQPDEPQEIHADDARTNSSAPAAAAGAASAANAAVGDHGIPASRSLFDVVGDEAKWVDVNGEQRSIKPVNQVLAKLQAFNVDGTSDEPGIFTKESLKATAAHAQGRIDEMGFRAWLWGFISGGSTESKILQEVKRARRYLNNQEMQPIPSKKPS